MARNYPRYVQVSPDAPDAWWDPKSGKWFRKEDGIIELEDGLNAANIIRYLRFNYLIDVTSLVNKPEPAPEPVKNLVEKTPRQLLAEDEAKLAASTKSTKEEEKDTEPVVEETAEDIVEQNTEEVTREVTPDGAQEEIKEEKSDKQACPYCGKEYSGKGLHNHIKHCKENPENK